MGRQGPGREPSEELDAQLSAAARGDDPAAVRALLNAGAAVDSTDADGFTALEVAVVADSYEATRLLLARGADADRRSRGGLTPLMLAADAGACTTLELLLCHRARHGLTDDLGRTALDLARARDGQSAVSTWHTVAVSILEPAFGIRAPFAELAARALAFADPDGSGPFVVRQLLGRRVDLLSRNEAAAALAAPDPRLRKFTAEVLWRFGVDVIRVLHDKEAQQWAAGLLRAHADQERDPEVLSEVVRSIGWHAEVDTWEDTWDRESRLAPEERARLQRFAAHSDPRVRDVAELALSGWADDSETRRP
ncbi:ankyrin repeat domain-containing protein [Streptomyces sp. NBC_01220]|uniref:ankyrin repeat domain-containing protein n=1 Tax=Streptomyces sp. NBC_01220 TaxID=2903781 RepID=UPI00352D8787|nr:ankyrin repeat domain-containing protein [Streptomyces sp. NBC_01220]